MFPDSRRTPRQRHAHAAQDHHLFDVQCIEGEALLQTLFDLFSEFMFLCEDTRSHSSLLYRDLNIGVPGHARVNQRNGEVRIRGPFRYICPTGTVATEWFARNRKPFSARRGADSDMITQASCDRPRTKRKAVYIDLTDESSCVETGPIARGARNVVAKVTRQGGVQGNARRNGIQPQIQERYTNAFITMSIVDRHINGVYKTELRDANIWPGPEVAGKSIKMCIDMPDLSDNPIELSVEALTRHDL